ncbi:MAG: phosphoribosyltransferase family protein [bacterium]|nr:phosphoribosyltransferase family protein [bacterium]
MTRKQIIKKMLEAGVIYKGPIKLSSKKRAGFYCDVKRVFGYPELLNALADEVGKLLTKKITCVAGSGYGGLPLASVVASRHGLNFIAVREKPKKHGKGGFVDGYVPNKKDKIVIVDDVITTGQSIEKVYVNLKKSGLISVVNILCAVVIVRREKAKLQIPYKYIFDIREIL